MQTAWSDAHTRLISYISDALADELPDDLLARAEENVSLCGAGEDDGVRRADVAVIIGGVERGLRRWRTVFRFGTG